MRLVMLGWMVFCVIVSHIFLSSAPIKVIFVLKTAISQPVETHVHRTCFSLFDCVCMMLRAVVLSVCIGVGGCGWPISISIWRNISAFFAFVKTPAISASAAEDIT